MINERTWCLPFHPIKSYPVYGVKQVLIAYRKIQALQGFLLVPMTHYHVGYHRVDSTTYKSDRVMAYNSIQTEALFRFCRVNR